jgi:hypothetical protein
MLEEAGNAVKERQRIRTAAADGAAAMEMNTPYSIFKSVPEDSLRRIARNRDYAQMQSAVVGLSGGSCCRALKRPATAQKVATAYSLVDCQTPKRTLPVTRNDTDSPTSSINKLGQNQAAP